MTKGSGKTKVEETTGKGEGFHPDMPEWATRDASESAMAIFVAPAENQYRRKLNEHELLAWIASQVRQADPDDPRMGLEIFAQVAKSGTIEEVLTGKAETTKGREILDVLVECDSMKFIQSTERGGAPFFVVMSVRRTNNGQHEVVTMGGWMLLAQCAQIHYMSTELPENSPFLVHPDTPGALAKESFPHYFKMRQKETASGHMNYLVPASA